MRERIIVFTLILLMTAPAFSTTAPETTPAPKEQAAPEAGDHNILYETIGVLSAHAIYLTYVSIGTLADGYAGKAYEKDFTLSLLDEYLRLIDTGVDQMNKLLLSGMIQGEDVTYINGIIEAYELLKAQGRGFKNYATTGDKGHLQVYSEKRQQAWDKITKLLGIK